MVQLTHMADHHFHAISVPPLMKIKFISLTLILTGLKQVLELNRVILLLYHRQECIFKAQLRL